MEQHITILEDMADPAASLEKMDVLSQELDEFEEQSKVCTSVLLAHLWGAYAIPIVWRKSCSWIVPPRYWWRPYITHKIMAQNKNFHIFDFFSENTSR